MFQKILIANRGEIACRIIDTARQLGIATVAVYSDPDRNALHVELADEAVHIGPAPARDSYLVAERILEAARRCGAQAIHPGYGFLSENAAFATACHDAGIVFIGPPAAAIEAIGSKSAAKRIMETANVPLVPGYHGADQDPEILRSAADAMGYPVLLKATAGGGGKGMRQVWSGDEFDDALAAARRESMASFGDDNMLVEKYLTRPRHVEIQVFCDNHGSGVYLAERDCSLQRRHQKVIEEAPAPGLDDKTRCAMGETAVKAARAIDYRGAGTVEFLLDEDGSFYFMEMNTRLQVEHPVTEMVTGQDLVEWQLRIASDEPLPLGQDDVKVTGHAFEARVYAEDPDNDFLPATGKLSYLKAPTPSRHVRVDTGVRQGDEISVFYDPMIAKLIVWDEDRDRALARLASALTEYRIGGTVTNLPFLHQLATCPAFMEADLSTGFIEQNQEFLFDRPARDLSAELPILAFALLNARYAEPGSLSCLDPYSPWRENTAWRMNTPNIHRVTLRYAGEEFTANLEKVSDGYRINVNGDDSLIRGHLEKETLHFQKDGHLRRGTLARDGNTYTLYLDDGARQFEEALPDTGEAEPGDSGGSLRAPMNGTVVTLLAAPGDAVDEGAPLLVMEAMKMEHTINAPAAGTVQNFYFSPGELVDGGAELVDFLPAEEA